jgi:hypothetical protein
VLALTLVAMSARADDAATPIAFSGFVDVTYAWNQNKPDNHENFYPGAGTTAKRANEFSLNLASVQWSRATSKEQPTGFTLSLNAGEGTDVVHAGEPGGADKYRYIYQVSAAYRLRSGVTLEGGVFPSHIGLEGFYSKDNWNYTRSIMGESSPYYQAGIKASYPFNEHWSARVDVLNGWQLINDNNDAKSIGTQLAYSNDKLTASFNTFYGAELAGDDDSAREFLDFVAVCKVSEALQLGATADFGSQQIPNAADARWNGQGLSGRVALGARNAVAVRLENFSDPDNGITGTAQRIREATLTWESRPHPNLIVKVEGRYDDSNADVFFTHDSTTDHQLLFVSGVVMTF